MGVTRTIGEILQFVGYDVETLSLGAINIFRETYNPFTVDYLRDAVRDIEITVQSAQCTYKVVAFPVDDLEVLWKMDAGQSPESYPDSGLKNLKVTNHRRTGRTLRDFKAECQQLLFFSIFRQADLV